MRAVVIEALKEQVIAAFFATTVLPETALLDPVDPASCSDWPSYRDKRESIVAPLRGVPWNELDPAERRKCLESTAYLSAAAFRYFLPAFLIGALEDTDFAWSTVVRICPSFCAIDHGYRDRQFDDLTGGLNDEQYRAVVSVLTWIAEGPRSFSSRYRAIECLKWGWTRLGVDVERIEAFYRSVRSYQRPTIEDPERERLARLCESAFADAPYPGDKAIVEHHCDECCEIAVEFVGVDWRSIDPAFLRYYNAAPNLFSDVAFRYYYPAYLLSELTGASAFSSDGVFHLTYGLEEAVSDQDPVLRRLAMFSKTERAALVAYLEHEYAQALAREDSNASEIRHALDVHWIPSLG